MNSHRIRRVNSLIKQEMAKVITGMKWSFSNHFITVTEVRTTKDFSLASIYVSIYGNSEKRSQGLKALIEDRLKLRHVLSRNLHLRRMPALVFELDESLDNAEKIDTILRNKGFDLEKVIEKDD